MASEEKALTPMMRQYTDLKATLPPGTLLFFRLGDFYEVFDEDAVTASRELELTLTKRHEQSMAGIPYHQLNNYLPKLLEKGLRCAVAEQTEDPAQAKGLVKREIVRIVTPGTILEEGILPARRANWLGCVVSAGRGAWGLALLDLSTGDFRCGSCGSDATLEGLIHSAGPAELLHAPDAKLPEIPPSTVLTPAEPWRFDGKTSVESLCRHLGVTTLDGFGLRGQDAAALAAGVLLDWARDTLRSEVKHVRSLVSWREGEGLRLDRATRRHLEIAEPLFRDAKDSTLLAVVDRSVTPMGARLLRERLLQPLAERAAIESRLEAVAALFAEPAVLHDLRTSLAEVRDIERIAARCTLGTANPRDLQALRSALVAVPRLRELLDGLPSPLLLEERARLAALPELATSIAACLVDEPPMSTRDGGLIRDGYNATLDQLRVAGAEGKDWLARYENDERVRSGIKTLKIRFNSVFGYYIELTKMQADNAPADYIRKQTLANAERFITPALKEMEDTLLHAEERAKSLEAALFAELRCAAAAETPSLQDTSRAVAAIDAHASLAETARQLGWVRPQLNDGGLLRLVEARHPVVDKLLGPGVFVPNDTGMDSTDSTLHLVTGPNMAGKSTYIRQIAAIAVLAQAGSFVPAKEAELPVFDAVFTRVGAADDLSRGQSTFMVEMVETANILNHAGPRSLVVLDEIGRGTSTYDGMSLAWAIAEHLHGVGCFSLFATHYHELTSLGRSLPRARNFNVAVKEWDDQIVFLHRIVPGGADRSYGLHVARLAGLPASVVKRAGEILSGLETGAAPAARIEEVREAANGKIPIRAPRRKIIPENDQPNLFDWGG